jgi:hypothetical protein
VRELWQRISKFPAQQMALTEEGHLEQGWMTLSLTLPSNPFCRHQKAIPPEHCKELSKRDGSSELINATPEKYREFKNQGDPKLTIY